MNRVSAHKTPLKTLEEQITFYQRFIDNVKGKKEGIDPNVSQEKLDSVIADCEEKIKEYEEAIEILCQSPKIDASYIASYIAEIPKGTDCEDFLKKLLSTKPYEMGDYMGFVGYAYKFFDGIPEARCESFTKVAGNDKTDRILLNYRFRVPGGHNTTRKGAQIMSLKLEPSFVIEGNILKEIGLKLIENDSHR